LASSASSLCLWAIGPYPTSPRCRQNRRLHKRTMQTEVFGSSIFEVAIAGPWVLGLCLALFSCSQDFVEWLEFWVKTWFISVGFQESWY
jgi:hypothetical protein